MSIITLLTDYGTADSYVGEVKGVLLTRVPAATLVDITHEIPPGDVAAGAFVLARTWGRFPTGTVHLVVIDPGVGGSRAAIAAEAAGHRFVGPDNGLFGSLGAAAAVRAVVLPVPEAASHTFHGRDLFAPAAAALAGGTPLAELGVAHPGPLVPLPVPEPHYEGKVVVGQVLYVDRYGNLVTNLTPDLVPPYAVLEVDSLVIGGLKQTFGDVAMGGLVAYIGSGGLVEVAVRGGSATRRTGLGVGGKVRARLG